MTSLTYKQAGVNINEGNRFVKDISQIVRRTFRPGVMTGLGGFGACFNLTKTRFKQPILVSSTDGVGTKLKIAILAGQHDTIGIDLVAMNANDVLAMGAEPLFFLDYIACGKLDRAILVDVVRGIVRGCKDAGCALIGGETAEMPGMYPDNEYDLAGFCVGAAERDELLTGSTIKQGQVLIGLESSGLHSNGFSLVRKIFSESELRGLAKQLLKPTRIYVKPVMAVRKKYPVHGIAHITGGAFYDKLPRILPRGCSFIVRKGSWPIPELFQAIQGRGDVEEREMFRTFNMGIGMVLVVEPGHAAAVQRLLTRQKVKSWVIGEVSGSRKKVEIIEA